MPDDADEFLHGNHLFPIRMTLRPAMLAHAGFRAELFEAEQSSGELATFIQQRIRHVYRSVDDWFHACGRGIGPLRRWMARSPERSKGHRRTQART